MRPTHESLRALTLHESSYEPDELELATCNTLGEHQAP